MDKDNTQRAGYAVLLSQHQKVTAVDIVPEKLID